jgi:hypothetical protein
MLVIGIPRKFGASDLLTERRTRGHPNVSKNWVTVQPGEPSELRTFGNRALKDGESTAVRMVVRQHKCMAMADVRLGDLNWSTRALAGGFKI